MSDIQQIIAEIRKGVHGEFDMSNREQEELLALCDSHDKLTRENAALREALERSYHAMRHAGMSGYEDDARAVLAATKP